MVGNAKKKGLRVKSLANARQVAAGLFSYATDNNRSYPDTNAAEYGGKTGSTSSGSLGGTLAADQRALYSHLGDADVFEAAGDEGDGVISDVSVFDAVGTSYIMSHANSSHASEIETIAGVRMTTVSFPSKKILICEPTLLQ